MVTPMTLLICIPDATCAPSRNNSAMGSRLLVYWCLKYCDHNEQTWEVDVDVAATLAAISWFTYDCVSVYMCGGFSARQTRSLMYCQLYKKLIIDKEKRRFKEHTNLTIK